MGRPMKTPKKGGRTPGKAGKSPAAKSNGLSDEMYDEVDRFHKAKADKDRLVMHDDEEEEEGLSDGVEDEEVFGLASDPEDSDEDEEEYDTDDEIEAGGKLGRLAKQAKALKASAVVSRGEAESDEEEEESEEEGEGVGGRKKSAYYGADNIEYELTDDDDELLEEEEAALAMQRQQAAKLSLADMGLPDDEDDADEDADEDDEAADEDVAVETVTKDLEALTGEEKMNALLADAPELLGLLADLKSHLHEVRRRVGPLLAEVRAGQLATAQGVSYLEAKNMLLLSYVTNIVFYLLLKAEGRPVKDHPVIARLVQLRAYLEKIRPIDKKLAYQIEKLLRAASAAKEEDPEVPKTDGAPPDADALAFRPNPGALRAKRGGDEGGADAAAGGDAGADEDGDGVYRPPKLNPTSMEGGDKKSGKDRRAAELASRRAARSGLLQEFATELAGAPQELRNEGAGTDSGAQIRQRQHLEARQQEEENMFSRVPLSKDERKRLKAARRTAMSGNAMMDGFQDDLADIVEYADAAEGRKLSGRTRMAQKFGGSLADPVEHTRGGDDELPEREPLGDRRARYDAAKARQAAIMAAVEEEEFARGGRKRERERQEDAFYKAAKEEASAKKRSKAASRAYPEPLPPMEDPRSSGARGISREIEKNRGLTPHRRKDIKNPRKKHRMAFEKAKVRRKGQVQEAGGAQGAYGGEATGIRSKVSKSRKMLS